MATNRMGQLGDDRYFAELEDETAKFAAAVHDADPDRPVPTCPEWTLGQLTEHVGQGQRWVTVVLERREPVPNAQVQVQVPEHPDERSAWLREGARRLGQTVRQVGPRTGVWSWSNDKTAGFWLRRITHDTLVHRLDAELAELRGDGETLQFHATDSGLGVAGEWLVRRTPSGLAWEQGHGRADVAVRGRAADLLLVLTRRAAPGARVEVVGDQRLFAHWLEHSRS